MSTAYYNLSINKEELRKIDVVCKVSNRFTITIPKPLRNKLELLPGDIVDLGVSVEDKCLLIKKESLSSYNNKMILSDRNAINIPMEYRKYLAIKKGDIFLIYTINNSKEFILRRF